ncbi:hypothetical protein HBI68_251760 [Parastagonospora nodorum]|nr:hypothetical protein HBI68_251760 [Parastagonospora nodorum]KAH6380490.1 hypothetical protein HBI08_237380 [Parastagonospora nodorum]
MRISLEDLYSLLQPVLAAVSGQQSLTLQREPETRCEGASRMRLPSSSSARILSQSNKRKSKQRKTPRWRNLSERVLCFTIITPDKQGVGASSKSAVASAGD